MGLLTKTLGINAMSMEDPAQPLLPQSVMFESLGMGRSDAGVMVNEKQSLRSTPIFAACKIISEDLSKIQFRVMQRMRDGSIRIAEEHPVHKLIHDAGNDMMTATVWRAAWIASAFLFGRGFMFINRDNAARPVSLHPLPSDRTSAVIINGEHAFMTTATETGAPKLIAIDNMLYLPGLTLDGVNGLSPVTTCKNAVGIALAAEKFSAQFFGNAGRTSGVLSHPGVLNEEAYERLKKSVYELATGDNALRPMILEEGLQWQQITISPNEGQMIETRQFQVEEVARLSRIPVHKLGKMDRSTNNNIEHQGREHYQDALQPWAVKIEQEVNNKLLGGRYFAEHDFSELERGDSVAQATSLQNLRNTGLITTDEGRAKLRLNPLGEEEGGNVAAIQGAMIPLSSLTKANFVTKQAQNAPKTEPNDVIPAASAEKSPLFSAFRRIFRDAVGRVANLKKPDPGYAYRALYVPVASLAEALLVDKGITALNSKDELAIATWTRGLVEQSAAWTPANASDIASQVTDEAVNGLLAKLLEV